MPSSLLSTLRITNRRLTVFSALVAACLSAIPGSAHVGLSYPVGGEVFTSGSTVTIRWHDEVSHGTADYDLWYSTNGMDGPWIAIEADLTFSHDGPYAYQWTVPESASEDVNLRVRQDNAGTDYEDKTNTPFKIVAASLAESVSVEPIHDVTLYGGDGSLANGAGEFLFTGRTENAAERRCLLLFDIAGSVPASAIVTSVNLELTMSRSTAGNLLVEAYRVLENWSEGPSDPGGQEGSGTSATNGDATWIHRDVPDVIWTNEGATVASSSSAGELIASLGTYTFASTDELVADVQKWLDDPESNFGWALIAPDPEVGNAKRFNSREHATISSRPRLTVTYEVGAETPIADFSFLPSSAMVGQEVQFEDLSSGSPSEWLWDFDDGSTSADQHPKHIFDVEGSYEVSLMVSNSSGSDSSTMEISVLPEEEPTLDELVVLPAAANAEGANNSFFVTTADVHNSGSSTAMLRFVWLPRETNNNSATESANFVLEAGVSQRFPNLLSDVFDLDSGVGAVAVMSDSPDIEIESRTFNSGGGSGTFGQSIPGVAAEDLIPAGTRVRILFLTQNDDFRSNLGFVSASDFSVTVQWEYFDASGTSLGTDEVTLPPWGNQQFNRVLRSFAPIEAAYADVWTTTSGGLFTCYASVLDEVTSDPTTVLPR